MRQLTLPPALPACSPGPQVQDEINSGALFGCLKFSLDGSMLLAVAEGRIYVLDSFEGKVMQKVGPCSRLLSILCGVEEEHAELQLLRPPCCIHLPAPRPQLMLVFPPARAPCRTADRQPRGGRGRASAGGLPHPRRSLRAVRSVGGYSAAACQQTAVKPGQEAAGTLTKHCCVPSPFDPAPQATPTAPSVPGLWPQGSRRRSGRATRACRPASRWAVGGCTAGRHGGWGL